MLKPCWKFMIPVGKMTLELIATQEPAHKSVTQKADILSFLVKKRVFGCMEIFKELKCGTILILKSTFLKKCIVIKILFESFMWCLWYLSALKILYLHVISYSK
jgi:hypothetical protein